MTNSTDEKTRSRNQIPVDLNQPIVLEVHNSNGDVTVRAAHRGDVLIGHDTHGLPGDFDDGDAPIIEARDNRIEVRPNPRASVGWAGITGNIDVDTFVGQITRAIGLGGPWSATEPGKARAFSGRHIHTDIAIDVPRAMCGRVEIHTASGDVRVEGVTGEIALRTMSGDLRVVRSGGELTLQTSSGDLVAEGVTGRLTAHTASGDVRVTAAQIVGFQIQTANGDVLLDALLDGDGPCRVQTASGDVRLTLRRPADGEEDPAATLAFHTLSGDAHVSPPFRKTDRRLWRTGSDERGPRIDVSTVSGDLAASISAADRAFIPTPGPAVHLSDVPSTSPVPPSPPVPPTPAVVPARPSSPTEQELPRSSAPQSDLDLVVTATGPEATPATAHGDAARLAVLEAVERGEIDVEEALRRLDAADAVTNP